MTERHPAPPEVVRLAVRLLDSQRLATVAVNGADGYPWAATVGYVNEGLTLYFVSARDSLRTERLAADDRTAAVVRSGADSSDALGVAMTGRAAEVLDPELVAHVNDLVAKRRSDQHAFGAASNAVALFRFSPESLSLVTVSDGRSAPRRFRLDTV